MNACEFKCSMFVHRIQMVHFSILDCLRAKYQINFGWNESNRCEDYVLFFYQILSLAPHKKNRRVGPTNRFRWHCSSEWNVISTICDILAIAGVDDCIVIDDCKYCYFSRYSAERSHTHTIEHNTSPIQIESGLNVFWVCRRNAQRAFHSMNFGAQFKFGWLRWVTNRAITTKGCTWKWYTNTPN